MNRRQLLQTLGTGAGGALMTLAPRFALAAPRVPTGAPGEAWREDLTARLAEAVPHRPQRLADVAPELARILKSRVILTPPRFAVSDIRCETLMIAMRDGVRLATDIYWPPVLPAPAIAVRTPYGRGEDNVPGGNYASGFLSFVRRGYVVISQDCRGTGDSEGDKHPAYIYEDEDGYDLVEWVSQQDWFDGFLGSCGGSYVGQTQWPMALHPRMSTIVPAVSGLGVAMDPTMNQHMFRNYGREEQMLEETLATGHYNEPLHQPFPEALLMRFPHLRALPSSQAKRWLWEHYCSLPAAGRAEFVKLIPKSDVPIRPMHAIFGHQIGADAFTLPHPRPAELAQSFHVPVLLSTGWYNWWLHDDLATWDLLMRAAPEPMRSRCRLLISPRAHNMPGYHEGMAEHPELHYSYGFASSPGFEMHLRWYAAMRENKIDAWPTVIYYLMGANEWHAADAWPLPDARTVPLYLGAGGKLTTRLPRPSAPDRYTYDPTDPTPTVGGSIVSSVYLPGSVDVSQVQKRKDVLTYTTAPLERDLDVVGPLRMILYASSSAVDTDFVARLSDVFPDGRAIQLQNGVLRARYRQLPGEPELLKPGRIYRLEIDMWATANRFKAGHRLRLDVSSADFPRFDRNTNRGGEAGRPVPARQTIYHDPQHPSHLLLSVLGNYAIPEKT